MRGVGTPGLRDLGRREVEALLARNRVGRVACADGERVVVVPAHYAYAGGWIYGATPDAGPLEAAADAGRTVTFAVDEVDGPARWRSVTVRGRCEVVPAGAVQQDWRRGIERLAEAAPGQGAAARRPAAVFRIAAADVAGREAAPPGLPAPGGGAAQEARQRHEPPWGTELVEHYLPDLVYGANDGIITTFAVVSGAAGGALSWRVILILGLANLLADGLSMGASNFLSIRSEQAVRASHGKSVSEPYPLRHGAATFAAFVVAGSVPLLPYVLSPARGSFVVPFALTLLTLFLVGALRALVTRMRWWRAGMEMLLVGAVAATVAYGVGALTAWVL